MGKDLKLTLLKLFNELKRNLEIPTFMNWANITSIHKKGSRLDMDNQRGIFGLSVFKKLAEYLLFEDLYGDINKGMSDSNIGGRKKRMAKDHLFVVYGIINDVVNGKSTSIDIRVKDIEKAFDKLWLEETLNDLCDTISKQKQNNKISLLYELNRRTDVAIKSPAGLTERKTFEDVVQQGGSFGAILCSNSLDKPGKKMLVEEEEDEFTYKYKDSIKIPSLAYIDDLFEVSKCGLESLENNVSISNQIEMKRLNFNVGNENKKSKCETMYVGKNTRKCFSLTVNEKVMKKETKSHIWEMWYLPQLKMNKT